MLEKVTWYLDFANYMVNDLVPEDLFFHQKRKFLHDVKSYFWDEPFLFRHCADNIIRRCILEVDMLNILKATMLPQLGDTMLVIVLQEKCCRVAIISQFKDAYEFVRRCGQFHRERSISKHHEMPMRKIMEVKLFDVWGIDLIGPFVSSYGLNYFLVTIDYVSK